MEGHTFCLRALENQTGRTSCDNKLKEMTRNGTSMPPDRVYLLRYYIMWTNNWLIHLGIIMTCNETIVSLKLLKINDIFVYYKHLNKWLNRISLSEGKDVYYKSLNIFYKSDSSPLHKKSIFEKVVACLISRNKWNKNINELLFQLWFPMMYFKYLLVPKGKQDNYF